MYLENDLSNDNIIYQKYCIDSIGLCVSMDFFFGGGVLVFLCQVVVCYEQVKYFYDVQWLVIYSEIKKFLNKCFYVLECFVVYVFVVDVVRCQIEVMKKSIQVGQCMNIDLLNVE